MLKIGFTYEDTDIKCSFSAESSAEMDYEFESDYDFIGEQFDNFLRQCGYFRGGCCILMDSLTEYEHDRLKTYLKKIREDDEEKDGTKEA